MIKIQVFSKTENKPRAYAYGEYDHPLSFDPVEIAISEDGKTWYSIFDNKDLAHVYCAKSPDVQPANPLDNYNKIAIQDGQRLISSSYDKRDFSVTFFTDESVDEGDTLLGFDALQRFLIARKPYWICFSTWPQRMYYVKAKLGTPSFYSDRSWSTTVTFSDLIGLSRSIGTSVNDRTIGFGNNESGKDNYSFTINGSGSFQINNLSDVLIDPERRGHPLVFTCDGQSNGNLKITNQTTGDWVKRGGFKDTNGKQSDSSFKGKAVLNGVRKILNDKSDDWSWDYSILTLQKGVNEFKVENFTGTVTVDFPFWWLS